MGTNNNNTYTYTYTVKINWRTGEFKAFGDTIREALEKQVLRDIMKEEDSKFIDAMDSIIRKGGDDD